MNAGWSDWLDGYLARLLGQQSILGSYLDPLADKVLISCVVGSLGYQVRPRLCRHVPLNNGGPPMTNSSSYTFLLHDTLSLCWLRERCHFHWWPWYWAGMPSWWLAASQCARGKWAGAGQAWQHSSVSALVVHRWVPLAVHIWTK